MPWDPSGLTNQTAQEQGGNDMAFRPLHDRVTVKRLEGEEKTAASSSPILLRKSLRKAK
jgi:hypothetical protein